MTRRLALAQKNPPTLGSPPGLTTVALRVATLMNASVRWPPSSARAATQVPLGETFAVLTLANRVKAAMPVGATSTANGAPPACGCLQEARATSAIRANREGMG